jgi:prepilin peptidase CpaA
VGFAVFAVAAALFAGNILGGGDAKLLGAVALWAGPAWVLEALLVTALLGGVAAVARLLRPIFLTPVLGPQPGARETSLPYGVAIAGGGLWVAGRMAGL